MIEPLGALFRFLQLASNMLVLGGCVFLAIAEGENSFSKNRWLMRLKKALPWFAVTLLMGLLGLLATTTAQATGIADNAWRPGAWLDFIQKTRIGLIWTAREACALVVFGCALYVRVSPGARWRYGVCASAAALTLAVGSFASHPAAEEQSVIAILPYTLHLILASIWFGALPGVLAVLFATGEPFRGPILDLSDIRPVKQFSAIALPVMIAVIATGLLVADRMVDTSYAALFATRYGWLLNTKIALLVVVLAIAARAHFVWLPSLGRDPKAAEIGTQELRTWLRVEFAVASVLVFVATVLANTIPAKHDIIDYWPYPFRFSIDATWSDWLVQTLVLSGIAFLLLAAGMIVVGRAKQWGRALRVVAPAALVACGLPLIVYPLAIQSYPETYRKTPVPFDAISIANGAGLFAANCVPCHGPQAKGNGILAKTLPKQPVDLLTEPHTAMHTAGDFFHWLTYGRFDGIMPAFGGTLSEEDRWDVLNFLHANARGYQARIINPHILPEQPFMVSPNFSYSAHDGSSGTLKDFRRKQAVLLVLFSWPESRERIEQLRTAYAAIKGNDTAVLAVPVNDLRPEDMDALLGDTPFPVVTQGAGEITRSYALFRRTITNPDLFAEGMLPKHMEFLFDRYGYLRARWIPEGSGGGWTDIALLMQQIDQLSRERELLPPPGDHVH
jgi:putative copper resistance protein D